MSTDSCFQDRPVKIFVATPVHGDSVKNGFHATILGLHIEGPKLGVRVDSKIYDECSNLPAARNRLVHAFLKTDADTILWFDSDEWCDAHELLFMARAASVRGGIVGAAVRLKCEEERWNFSLPEGGIVQDPFVQVRAIGTGALAVHRSVIEELQRKHPTLWYRDHRHEHEPIHKLFDFELAGEDPWQVDQGEDYRFCMMAQDAGFKVWLDTRPRVVHLGAKGYEGDVRAALGFA